MTSLMKAGVHCKTVPVQNIKFHSISAITTSVLGVFMSYSKTENEQGLR